ncbi:hypothetical protein QCA50_003791 [Cerrena zonata]|uniref:Uncharacterized protein n=1 Tax=Cerrena zonata TaxID=2478898 RepID=A0AAW0GSE9_9APHY
MMTRYHVFLGAPSSKDIYQDIDDTARTYRWNTVTFPKSPPVLPSGTMEAVSRRISMLYENIIFDDEDHDGADYSAVPEHDEVNDDAGKTTFITWPASTADNTTAHMRALITSRTGIEHSMFHATTNISLAHALQGTQETQDTGSYDYSDASSIARFPAFHFSLHGVTSLSSLIGRVQSEKRGGQKVNVLVAILEVEGPDVIRLKKGIDAGKEVGILKLILGEEDGGVCKLTAWREVAEAWGGSDPDPSAPGIKRGDVVLLENVQVTSDPASTSASHLSLTASPYLKSRAEICFRTMPNSPEDVRFRPDLRLGISDNAVGRVAALVSWFESMAGLS